MALKNFIITSIINILLFAEIGFCIQTEIIVRVKQDISSKGKASIVPLIKNKNALRSIAPIFSPEITNKKIQGAESDFFDSFYLVSFFTNAEAEYYSNILKKSDIILYAEKNHLFTVHHFQNDPLYQFQWGLDKINIEGAWSETEGDEKVIIGLVDSGIDYLHEDLKKNIWINKIEDINGDGKFTDGDKNGIDDDGNGYIDDVIGWDFTDAESYPDNGDYKDEDNDPSDELGHGTAMAGIIAALRNNGKGIAGIAPKVKIMNLRAATARGNLEEDDVARAIIYALNNGSKIINLSFGDVVYSRFLKDIIDYAYENGCLIISSAGNSASAEQHYPSGFENVIAVGASNEHDRIAGFSNFGKDIDIYAPGSEIYTATLNNLYITVEGTSASAAFVSGVAALIISHFKDIDNANVKSIITSNSDFLGESDNVLSGKRLNAEKCLKTTPELTAHLRVELNSHKLIFTGTASGLPFLNYSIFYTVSEENQNDWLPIIENVSFQRVKDSLGDFDVSAMADTTYYFKLQVAGVGGKICEDIARFVLDRTPPEISHIKHGMILDKSSENFYIETSTNEPCWVSVVFWEKNSAHNKQKKENLYFGLNHRIVIDKEEMGVENFYFSVLAENASHLITESSSNEFTFERSVNFNLELNLSNREINSGYFLPVTADFNSNGKKELVLTKLRDGYIYENLEIYEWDGGDFQRIYIPYIEAIPRDIGDIDLNGKQDLLMTKGLKTYLYEASEINGFPDKLKLETPLGFAGIRFFDFDGDSILEVVGMEGRGLSVYKFENNGLIKIQDLENYTDGNNFMGMPHCVIGDPDNDNNIELFYGDTDGDLVGFEYSGGTFRREWDYRLQEKYQINYITLGDINGDGKMEIIAGGYSDSGLKYIENAKTGMWDFSIYESTSDNNYQKIWGTSILGVAPSDIFMNGIASGDLDNDNDDEFIISTYPDLYIFDYSDTENSFYCTYYLEGSRTSQFLLSDINNNNMKEIYFNLDNSIHYLENNSTPKPVPPYHFSAVPEDTNLIKLQWEYNDNSASFIIYRGPTINEIAPFHQTDKKVFYDSIVVKNNEYWYAVSAISTDFTLYESDRVIPIKVVPHQPAGIINARFVPPGQVIINFDRALSKDAENVNFYTIFPNNPTISSALLLDQNKSVVLTMKNGFSANGMYTLECTELLTDESGMKIDKDKNRADFDVLLYSGSFYIEQAAVINERTIEVKFNLPVDTISALEKSNYSVDPGFNIENVCLKSGNFDIIQIKVAPEKPLGAFGIDYQIEVNNIRSISGILVQKGNSFTIRIMPEMLADVFVFPDPCTNEHSFITFANITKNSTINIMSSTGKMVKILHETEGKGGVIWDLKDRDGDEISAGIYLFVVRDDKNIYKGKFAVVR